MHYLYTIAGLAALLSSAQAVPTQHSTNANLEREVAAQSKGVKLYAKGYSSADRYYLNYQRISQGVNIAVVTAGKDKAPVFWEDNIYKTGIFTDIPGVYPLGITVQPVTEFDSQYPAEHDVSINVGQSSWLALDPGYLSGPYAPPRPDPEAQYLVCDRDVALGGAGKVPLKVVRLKYTGESVPAGCAVVEFTPECAVLEDLPAGSSWNHDHAVTLTCSPL
ncbi:uncharacterized protein B0I36DRAFT_358599 [Microdochium trichocladiopsis]|uniref:DUF7907 domain-containing protein n=1 Tax=Microdochium trichocladiopsis TaxID=1682393 RepID=A0A9P9BWH8_9PEZI|nr:uncharacterized protein B0I36DRAFT_358599 [Microdochium trichocladiopsis]KAH7041428.1 hypothetical protein B0I36DRAFT_358599 [Microdochium trichocladiopsis]